MPGSYLPDTNILAALFNGAATVQSQIDNASEVFLCSIVLGELQFGALKSSRSQANVARINWLIEFNEVLNVDLHAAVAFGEIKLGLVAKGRPIPDNDIWIAAVAKHYNLTLVTRDTHFDHIDGVKRVSW